MHTPGHSAGDLPPLPSGEEDDAITRRPLGVPADYVARTERRAAFDHNPNLTRSVGGHTLQPPRFYEEHVYAPISWAPEKVLQWQKAMATAGLIGPKTKIRPGVWDSATQSAYREVLSHANRLGTDETTALRQLAATPQVTVGGEEEGERRLPVRVTNPNDLRAIAKQTARQVIGRGNVDDDFLNRFTQAFHQAQISYQQAAQTQDGGVVVEAPDPEGMFTQMLESDENYGKEAGAHEYVRYFQMFLDMLRNPVSGGGR